MVFRALPRFSGASFHEQGKLIRDYGEDRKIRKSGNTRIAMAVWPTAVEGVASTNAIRLGEPDCVYVLKRGNEPAIERIRVSDGKTEIGASLAGVKQTGFRNAVWTGLTPDNDPLILSDVGTEELYSLDTIVH